MSSKIHLLIKDLYIWFNLCGQFLVSCSECLLAISMQLYHILGLNQLVVWFTSATHPNLDFKNLTFLEQKNEVLTTADMLRVICYENANSKRTKYEQQRVSYIFSITDTFSLNIWPLFVHDCFCYLTHKTIQKQSLTLFAIQLFLKEFFCMSVFL